MEKLEGIVASLTYQNEDSGFTVVQLQTCNRSVSCVGSMPTVRKGESVEFTGTWQHHKKFGLQFSVSGFSIKKPTTLEGIEQLLASGFISNIGPLRAHRIISSFGLDTLTILDSDPLRLLEVHGIGKKTAEKIAAGWQSQKSMRDLMLFLQDFGVSTGFAAKIFKAWGADSQQKICENPYSLIDEIWGVGFKKADAIASRLGFSHDSYKRIRAGLIFSLQEACSEGHTFLPKEELLIRAAGILEVSKEQITFSLDHAVDTGLFIYDDDSVYLPHYFNAERKVALKLTAKINCNEQIRWSTFAIEPWLDAYQLKNGWKGAPEQLDAVRSAMKNRVILLTGGPGTGKTTVLQVIVALFSEMRLKIQLAAPTGRAAQRMGNISGLKARTLHRLLEYKPGRDRFSFSKNEKNPLDADVVILDEVSMIDLMLMKNFLNALRVDTHLILVGDDNQLPSVSAGNVLSDLIFSRAFPHIQLTRIFRQAAESRIVTAAHDIINGITPAFTNRKSENCFFLREEDPQKSLETIVDLVTRRIPGKYGLDPVRDIQILSPMHKGILGTATINTALQNVLNKNSQKVLHGNTTFILGDKVMQIRNNYDQEVFNGDIGTICSVTDGAVGVEYEGTVRFYEHKDLEELVLAYCISIHKSQGCEFKAVVVPVSTQHFVMLQRNLIYTALTRARLLCIMVGTSRALNIAVRNDQALKRCSKLGELMSRKDIFSL